MNLSPIPGYDMASCHQILPASLSWQSMFKELKRHHQHNKKNPKNKKPIPSHLVRWMGMQQRQYRVYGIGLKEPVGIIKNRVKLLTDLGFQWNPTLDVLREQEEEVVSDDGQEDAQVVQTSNRSSNRKRGSYAVSKQKEDDDDDEEEEEVEEEDVNPYKRHTSSSRRRRSVDSDREGEAVAQKQVPPPLPKTNAPFSGGIKGITRSTPHSKWQVRTTDNRERIYLGSYEHYDVAVAALREYEENRHNQYKASKTAPAKKKTQKKKAKAKGGKKKWKVNLNHEGKQIYVGSYDTHAEAADALKKAKQTQVSPEKHEHVKGITKNKRNGHWEVRIDLPKNGEKRRKYVGSYSSEAEAIEALNRAQKKLHEDTYDSSMLQVEVGNHGIDPTDPSVYPERFERLLKIAAAVKFYRKHEQLESRSWCKTNVARKFGIAESTFSRYTGEKSPYVIDSSLDAFLEEFDYGEGTMLDAEQLNQEVSATDIFQRYVKFQAQDNEGGVGKGIVGKLEDNDSQIGSKAGQVIDHTMATPIKSNISSASKSSSKKRSLFRREKTLKPGHVRGLTQRQNGKWEVRCYIKGTRTYIGTYRTREDALAALREAGADGFEEPNDNDSLSVESGSKETDGGTENNDNDDITVNTMDTEIQVDDDNSINTQNNDDETATSIGNHTEDDTTDGEVEPESPKGKYFPLLLYQMINDSSESSPEVSM
eukprot:scaffold27465_cov59-Cyclotella_meneghiniana.AAC.3